MKMGSYWAIPAEADTPDDKRIKSGKYIKEVGVSMGQKDKIISLLKLNGAMTQGALAEAIYGEKNHSPKIYASLTNLVNKEIVIRTGSNPSYYHLSDDDVVVPSKPVQSKKGYRDVSVDVITNETIEEATSLVQNTENYGPEIELITVL